MTCQKTIRLTNYWGKAGKRKCGKPSVALHSGIPMCQKCLNKIVNKSAKAILRKDTGLTNSMLNQIGLVSNNGNLMPKYIWRRWRGNGSIIADIEKPIYYDYPKHRGIRGFQLTQVFVRYITEEEYKKEKEIIN